MSKALAANTAEIHWHLRAGSQCKDNGDEQQAKSNSETMPVILPPVGLSNFGSITNEGYSTITALAGERE